MVDEPSRSPITAPELLASDAEREQIAGALRDAAAEGRLSFEELTGRLGLAYGSRTRAELVQLTDDLPVAADPAAARPSALATRRRTRWVVALMSGAYRRGRWQTGERCVAVAVMGGCKLDLREAEIAGPQLNIVAVSVMGGIEILVAEGVEVNVGGLSIVGGKHVDVADIQPLPGTPIVNVRGLSIMGALSVKSRPARRRKRRVDAEQVGPSDRKDLLPGGGS